MAAITQDGLARRRRGARREGGHRRDSRFAGFRRGGRGDRRRGEVGRHPARAGGQPRCAASSKRRRGWVCIARASSTSRRCRCRWAGANTMRWRAPSASARSRWSRTRATSVPLPLPRTGSVLYLSVLDYPSGWRIAAPSRTMIPELKARWPSTEAIEISDRTTPAELDLVRAMADDYDAIVAGIFVRASSGSGRLDLAPQVVRLLQDLSRDSERALAAVGGGVFRQSLHADVRAGVAGDVADLRLLRLRRTVGGEGDRRRDAIRGKLPITLPGLFPLGQGSAWRGAILAEMLHTDTPFDSGTSRVAQGRAVRIRNRKSIF